MLLSLCDLETTKVVKTGQPAGEIISAAVVLVDILTLEATVHPALGRSCFEWHMHPRRPEQADPKALEINGYDFQNYQAKMPCDHSYFARQFCEVISGTIFFSQNVSFDRDFINMELRRQQLDYTGHYHSYDLASIGLPLLWEGKIPKLSLQNLCDYYEIRRVEAHTAMGDCIDMLAVLRRHQETFRGLFK